LMNVDISFSCITFPGHVCHFIFGKRRRKAVFLSYLFVTAEN
jgi:hypothetical protein